MSSPQHESGEPGYIVNTASIYGLASATSAYGITKQSVVAISEAFQSSLAAQGSAVQVASLCPSFHSTNIGAAEYEKQQIPTGTPEQQARKQWMDVGTLGALRSAVRGELRVRCLLVQAILSNGPGPANVARCVFEGVEAGAAPPDLSLLFCCPPGEAHPAPFSGHHYIHTHPDVSKQMFADRIKAITGEELRVTTEGHDAVLARLGEEAGVGAVRPTAQALATADARL